MEPGARLSANTCECYQSVAITAANQENQDYLFLFFYIELYGGIGVSFGFCTAYVIHRTLYQKSVPRSVCFRTANLRD